MDADVAIVGAGFAGLAAARELRWLGRSAVVVEARDRIGGRTWTDERLGTVLELGGEWVHWLQAHVWAEVTRYGLETIATPWPDRLIWIAGGERRFGTLNDYVTRFAEAAERLTADAAEVFPFPFLPFANPEAEPLDQLSVADRVEHCEFTEEEREFVLAVLASNLSANPADAALTHLLRVASLMGTIDKVDEVTTGYGLALGTRSLAEAMAHDAELDVRLSTEVIAIDHKEGEVLLETSVGDRVTAPAVVVTVPINVIRRIEFRPELSPRKQEVVFRGQASRGVKAWARVRGTQEPFLAFAPLPAPFAAVQSVGEVEGDSVVECFGADADLIDPADREAVEAALRVWIPDIEVVAATGHDWTHDPYAGQTWLMPRPGQLFTGFPELRRPEAGIHFAGSDYATGWAGFIDGAIESGMQVARRIASS
jgi:monoamine oxidase